MRRLWMLSYDIACDRRRRAIVKCLEEKGDRVQESVFELYLRYDEVKLLRTHLEILIESSADKCALFPLCRWCQEKVDVIGHGRRSTQPQSWVV